MKRSEMLDTIKNIMEECIDDAMINEVDEWTECILKEIELQGMLPPHCGKVKQVNIENKWGVPTGEQKMLRVIVTEWEDE